MCGNREERRPGRGAEQSQSPVSVGTWQEMEEWKAREGGPLVVMARENDEDCVGSVMTSWLPSSCDHP